MVTYKGYCTEMMLYFFSLIRFFSLDFLSSKILWGIFQWSFNGNVMNNINRCSLIIVLDSYYWSNILFYKDELTLENRKYKSLFFSPSSQLFLMFKNSFRHNSFSVHIWARPAIGRCNQLSWVGPSIYKGSKF
jgi:hypothetical protein